MREAFVRKPERKRPLGRPRHSWEDNININLKEIGLVGMGWINLAKDREIGTSDGLF